MSHRPYVLLSAAVSVDGYLDDASPDRLLLSNPEDFDRVDALRADCDAILVGANTLRRDNPRLRVAAEERRAQRVAAGKPEHPLKVIVSASGELDPALRVWRSGGDRLVYTTDAGAARLGTTLSGLADGDGNPAGWVGTVVSLGAAIGFGALLDDLGRRGVERLMVEGGGRIHTAFLADDLADELLLAVAPILVGDPDAPRFLHPAAYPGGPRRRMELADLTRIGDVALLRYLPKTDGPTPDRGAHT